MNCVKAQGTQRIPQPIDPFIKRVLLIHLRYDLYMTHLND